MAIESDGSGQRDVETTLQARDAPARQAPAAPEYESLPARIERSVRGGPVRCALSVTIEVVTPILGGAPETRALDEVDVIRPATVRGHLRFWWRALRAHGFKSPRELYEAESKLWGRAADEKGGRSAVDLRIEVQNVGGVDSSDVRAYNSRQGRATPGAYALWPARAERRHGVETKSPAPRRKPGTKFLLTLVAPEDHEAELRNVVRTWVLFGGYGSRTRRGVGSLTVVGDRATWLPENATREALGHLFGRDLFASPDGERTPADTPWLAGAALHVGGNATDAVNAWTTALGWLHEFRQGTNGGADNRAREPGTGLSQPNRPSISNWPEADKLRHLTSKTAAHPPRHNATPAWPRAGFGLPIIGRFQKKGRNGDRLDEPADFELRWRSPQVNQHERSEEHEDRPNEWTEHDRLASPLIVKALPLGNGSFVPCALWLNRAHPEGEVVVKGRSASGAPFNRLVANDDNARFNALSGKSTLRDAFLGWLLGTDRTTAVAP